mmetsp:Transcript_34049/g.101423  ORF Transcript_34049/g.101423 Transcript_34049/m.101423 type:complete len:343 (-) Transcript_34049:716-1744(-)
MENAGRNALLVEIRAHRVRQLLAPRQPPEAAQLPSSRVVGGYIKSTCSACLVATCWRKASEDEPQTVTCGACVKLGPLDMECGICGSLSARLPVPACHNDFCMGCLGKWICVQIEDGIAHPSCPMPGCGEALSEPAIKHLGKRGLLSDGHQRRLQELRNAGKRDVLRHVLSGEDPALTEWAMTSTQACPHCFVLVQKSTGCNHITCSCKGGRLVEGSLLLSVCKTHTRSRVMARHCTRPRIANVCRSPQPRDPIARRVLLHLRRRVPAASRPPQPRPRRGADPQPAGRAGTRPPAPRRRRHGGERRGHRDLLHDRPAAAHHRGGTRTPLGAADAALPALRPR